MDRLNVLLSACDVSKSFGEIKACTNINLEIYKGEIHTLLGENGAGKSTLINILSGIYAPDRGSIFLREKRINFTSPKVAIENGIGTVYQHFKLIDTMTAGENIMLGQKGRLFGDAKSICARAAELSERYGLNVNLEKYVGDMSLGEKQNLEILKVLSRGARLLILDEPTTVFTPQETKSLFNIMRRMKEDGCSIIFISHKMDEVMEISDRITVLRRGESIVTYEKKDVTPEKLTEVMVGSSIDLSIEHVAVDMGDTILNVNKLSVLNDEGNEGVKELSFELKSGEILGIAGIADSGQKELCEAIAGIRAAKMGEIIFNGENLEGKNPREFMKRGITMGFIPEDRLGMGLVGSMDIVDNLLLKTYHNESGLLLKRGPIARTAEKLVKSLEIKTPGINYPIRNLSGGNIQKVLLGREIGLNPKLLIMAYPLRGLDINTCHNIYKLINEEKKKGTAIVFVGEDLDVLVQLCDRIMVLSHGSKRGIIEREEATKEKIGLMMLGVNYGEGEYNAG